MALHEETRIIIFPKAAPGIEQALLIERPTGNFKLLQPFSEGDDLLLL